MLELDKVDRQLHQQMYLARLLGYRLDLLHLHQPGGRACQARVEWLAVTFRFIWHRRLLQGKGGRLENCPSIRRKRIHRHHLILRRGVPHGVQYSPAREGGQISRQLSGLLRKLLGVRRVEIVLRRRVDLVGRMLVVMHRRMDLIGDVQRLSRMIPLGLYLGGDGGVQECL